MYKGINIIINEGLGFKLTNSMSFGKSIFSVGFIQKTIKADLNVRLNHAYPQLKQTQKVPEDSRGLHTEAECETPPVSPPVVMSVLHRLLDCIYAIYSSRFDSRAQD